MKIGDRIKRRRQELMWSQRDLASKMNYNHSTITRIETGKIDISQSRIVQFAKVLGVSVAYLMGWEEDGEKQSAESELSIKKKEFIRKVEGMTDSQIERLEQILALVEQTDL